MRLENPEKRGKRSEYSRQNFKMLICLPRLFGKLLFSSAQGDQQMALIKCGEKKFEMRENEGFRNKNAGKMKEFYIRFISIFLSLRIFFRGFFFEFLPCMVQAKNLHIFAPIPIVAKNYL
jgi:hypothetical protein